MARNPCGWAIACSAIAVLFCACARLGAAGSSPEDLLKSHGLKLVGSLYVLELETDIQKKATEIHKAARKLRAAQARQRAAGSPEDYEQAIKELGQEIKGYQSEIQAANMRMNQLPRYGRGYSALYSTQAYTQLLAYRTQMQMQLSQANASLNELKKQPFDAKSKEKIDAFVQEEQDNYDRALVELRELVDSASKKYAELREDNSVTKALYSLAKSAKVKPKLGPSPHYLSTVKLLEKLEKAKSPSEAADSLDDSPRTKHRSTRSRRGSTTDPAKAESSKKSE